MSETDNHEPTHGAEKTQEQLDVEAAQQQQQQAEADRLAQEQKEAEQLAAEREKRERERKALKDLIKDRKAQLSRKRIFWYTLYFIGLHLSVIFSVAAAVILTLDSLATSPKRIDWAVGLIVSAVVMSLLSSAAGYNRNWRVNSYYLGRIELLEVAMTKDDAVFDEIRNKLTAITEDYAQGKTGMD